MKKSIKGYYVRECGDVRFSTEPFEDNGYFDSAGYWNHEFETEGTLFQLVDLDEILQLSRDISDNTPHSCKITIELEPCDYKSRREEERKRDIARYIRGLAIILECDSEKLSEALQKASLL